MILVVTNNEDLLARLKNYLDITWEDPEEDKKLIGIIKRGITSINRIAGKELEYSEESKECGLLLNYCMYSREKRLHEFHAQYKPELIELQVDCEVANGK